MKYLLLLFILLTTSCSKYESWRTKCLKNNNILVTSQCWGYEPGDTIIENEHRHVLLNKLKN